MKIVKYSEYMLFIVFDKTSYFSLWNFREEDYSDIVLIDAMEIHIIELSKIEEYSENKELDIWVNFINEAGDFDMSKANEQIKKAKEMLEEISENEHEQYLAHLREKYILDQNNLLDTGYERGFEKGLSDGFEQGIEQGIEQGFEQGSKQEKIAIAKEMRKQDYTIEEIQKITKLTKEEIEKL